MGEQEKLGRAPLSRGVRLKGNKKKKKTSSRATCIEFHTTYFPAIYTVSIYTLHYVRSNGKTSSPFSEKSFDGRKFNPLRHVSIVCDISQEYIFDAESNKVVNKQLRKKLYICTKIIHFSFAYI